MEGKPFSVFCVHPDNQTLLFVAAVRNEEHVSSWFSTAPLDICLQSFCSPVFSD